MTHLVRVENLAVHFQSSGGGLLGRRKRVLKAVDDVSFSIRPGETLGIVGESGCGKSTLSRAMLGFVYPERGAIYWGDTDITRLGTKAMNSLRRDIQVVFQSPLASLNPRMTVGDIITEPLDVFEPGLSKGERLKLLAESMERVGLRPETANRYPNEFSGGQCQRISIARAIILKPKLLICDEAVSALDVSIKAQIINLLQKLQRESGIAILSISHDFAVVRQISDRILVMYLGKVMELAPTNEILTNPRHPYTKALLEAVPHPDPAIERNKPFTPLTGDLPSPMSPPSGCVFRTRCPIARPNCVTRKPELLTLDSVADSAPEHRVACHYA